LYKSSNKAISIRFSQVFNPDLLLGASDTAGAIYKKKITETHNNQKKDILATYRCPNQWELLASEDTTIISKDTHKAAKVVDFDTCETTLDKVTKHFKGLGQSEKEIDKNLKERGLKLDKTDED
jgi:hypothetical protein